MIHYEIVQGDKLRITVVPKGFGSENMSRVYMLKPADEFSCLKISFRLLYFPHHMAIHMTANIHSHRKPRNMCRICTQGYLRKSIVKDPLIRENTKDNTPAVIHYEHLLRDFLSYCFKLLLRWIGRNPVNLLSILLISGNHMQMKM